MTWLAEAEFDALVAGEARVGICGGWPIGRRFKAQGGHHNVGRFAREMMAEVVAHETDDRGRLILVIHPVKEKNKP